jgi:DNA-binding NarL/FixJ family response regulator
MISSIRVLCVEDNALVAEAIGRKLSRDPAFEWMGSAETASELLAKIDATAPHVLCMDLHVPGMDTLAFVRRLTASHPQLRIMILSGGLTDEVIRAATEAGACGVMSKADESREIVAALMRVAAGEFVIGRVAQHFLTRPLTRAV